MRRLLVVLAALAAVAYLCTPPRARQLPQAPSNIAAPVRGVFHVHTRRSDGSGRVQQVARAAERAGLRFIVISDHGDATRTPDAPAYYGPVLVIDAVEISTYDGHVIALDLPRSPYPLAGEGRDVVEDVIRMGGVAFAAHPMSRKPDLRWTDWSLPIHGLEHLNGDSEWRDETPWVLARALFAYPVRPAETLGLLFDRSQVLQRWDALTRTRRVVALAGADAHGRIGLRAQEPYVGRLALPVPGYEAVFRSASIALDDSGLSGDAATDARTIVDRVRGGRLFSSVDAMGLHPRFAFTAASGRFNAAAGETLTLDGSVRIDAAVQAPPDAEIVLMKDGVRLAAATGSSLRHEADAIPAMYRVEVMLPGAPGTPPVPWIVSNPIYVGRRADETPKPALPPAPSTRTPLYVDGPAPEWVVEHGPTSQGAVDVVKAVTGTQLLLRFALSGTGSSHPFAALVAPVGPALAAHDRLTFKAHADRPMRISVQVRAPAADASGERWHRSVFIDTVPREISVRFDDMRPRGVTSTPTPVRDRIRWVLFVIDTVNTPAGTAGQLFLDDVRYER